MVLMSEERSVKKDYGQDYILSVYLNASQTCCISVFKQSEKLLLFTQSSQVK